MPYALVHSPKSRARQNSTLELQRLGRLGAWHRLLLPRALRHGCQVSLNPRAVHSDSRSAAYVYADWNIRCNVIQPGSFATKMAGKIQSNHLIGHMVGKQVKESVLLHREGRAEETATIPVSPRA